MFSHTPVEGVDVYRWTLVQPDGHLATEIAALEDAADGKGLLSGKILAKATYSVEEVNPDAGESRHDDLDEAAVLSFPNKVLQFVMYNVRGALNLGGDELNFIESRRDGE